MQNTNSTDVALLYNALDSMKKAKLPDLTTKGNVLKLIKEAKEALEEEDPEKFKYELADCLHCVLLAAMCNGISAEELMHTAHHKVDINMKRTFIRQPDGTYQHFTNIAF